MMKGNLPGENSLVDFNYNLLCVPSQYGGLPVCLHWQSQADSSFSALIIFGLKSPFVCVPSQKGCSLDNPHAHQAYLLPSFNSTSLGSFAAMWAFDMTFYFNEL
jgi:hypothetical protein